VLFALPFIGYQKGSPNGPPLDPPAPTPERPALARRRSEVDRKLAERIQAGKEIQGKFVGSHLHLISSTKWRLDYQNETDKWKEYNLETYKRIVH
jgi:hypothetical protein